jgi:dephospho-CoA kinase
MTKAIALTGGIGAGKSSVSLELKALGYVVEDADQLSREVLFLPEVAASVCQIFGADAFVSEGVLNRAKVRQEVFAAPEKRKALEAILHPAIAEAFRKKQMLLSTLSQSAWFFYEAALIFETNRAGDFDAVIVVHTPVEVRIRRLMELRGMAEKEARSVVAAQMSDEEKIARADFVIENTGNLAELSEKIHTLLDFLRARFSHATV